MKEFLKQNKRAIFGGIITFVIIAISVFLLGNISGYEARILLGSSLMGINMLCNTIILASATILALLLTLLGISSGTKSKLKDSHYLGVMSIAKIDTFLFIITLILFQLFNIPITEADNVPTIWFKVIYWATLIMSSMLSGLMVVVILMLYNTVSNIILIVGLKQDHPLLYHEKEKAKKDRKDLEKDNKS
ncbi:hypothetical protein [Bizionia arctica]|uniref:Uncharacterized protein n=1 Tax=Bizionia arctica TaxID=1495645 RepID=A0A917GWP8_9FLAO|nr:hypothetical protein [Bizionia arctica]GGG58419.1 hypothetical protein GCM10010976_31540 [Bizionia arctica]